MGSDGGAVVSVCSFASTRWNPDCPPIKVIVGSGVASAGSCSSSFVRRSKPKPAWAREKAYPASVERHGRRIVGASVAHMATSKRAVLWYRMYTIRSFGRVRAGRSIPALFRCRILPAWLLENSATSQVACDQTNTILANQSICPISEGSRTCCHCTSAIVPLVSWAPWPYDYFRRSSFTTDWSTEGGTDNSWSQIDVIGATT